MADFWDGLWLGVWFLGAARGSLAGTLVWSRFDQHVFVANCEGMQDWLDSGDSCGGVDRAPWAACNVGAPKKASKRGANLKGVGNKVVKAERLEQPSAEAASCSGASPGEELQPLVVGERSDQEVPADEIAGETLASNVASAADGRKEFSVKGSSEEGAVAAARDGRTCGRLLGSVGRV
jgi:hypothetical protein